MKILLVAGSAHQVVYQYITKGLELYNSSPQDLQTVLAYLDEESPKPQGVLITEDALSGDASHDAAHLQALLEWLGANGLSSAKVILVTRDPWFEHSLGLIPVEYGNLKILTCDAVRISGSLIQTACRELLDKKKAPVVKAEPVAKKRDEISHPKEQEKKKSFFDRFRMKNHEEPAIEATDPLTRELANISRGISRIIAITGHRGSGVTSTVVNLASEASKRGLSSIIVDLDVDYRSMNMYFSSFHESTKRSEEMNASLIRTLARPQDYMTTAFNLKENMWLTGLGYDFSDHKLMEQFYNSNKLVGMLSLLRTRFNLVLLDLPLDLFRIFRESLIHIDLFGLCVPNNLYAVLSTIRNVETVLDRENAKYVNAKSKLVITQYNDRSRFQDSLFTPDKVGEVMASGLSDYFSYEMSVAGNVPYSPQFDSQIENDIPLVNSGSEYEKAFGQLLLRMMEGA